MMRLFAMVLPVLPVAAWAHEGTTPHVNPHGGDTLVVMVVVAGAAGLWALARGRG